MKGKRTNIDFSEHELTVQTSDIGLTVHTLKIPDRGSHHKFVIARRLNDHN